MKVGEIVVPVDATDDAVHRFCDRDIAIGSNLSNLIRRGNCSSFFGLGGKQVEFLLDGFSGGFRQPDCHKMGFDPAAIVPDQ